MSTPASESVPLPLPRVLVVDDDADTLAMLGRVLTLLGVDAVPATTCNDARRAAALVRDPDLVITDASLPDGDGVVCAAEFKGRYGCATLVLSGHAPPADRAEGADEWLMKPVDLVRLRETVTRLLAGRAARDGGERQRGASPARA